MNLWRSCIEFFDIRRHLLEKILYQIPNVYLYLMVSSLPFTIYIIRLESILASAAPIIFLIPILTITHRLLR